MESLNQFFDANNSALDWIIFDLMKATSDIYSKQNEISNDSINQIEVVIKSLKGVVERTSKNIM
jgi:cob(I)alamin adenosyltransferase